MISTNADPSGGEDRRTTHLIGQVARPKPSLSPISKRFFHPHPKAKPHAELTIDPNIELARYRFQQGVPAARSVQFCLQAQPS